MITKFSFTVHMQSPVTFHCLKQQKLLNFSRLMGLFWPVIQLVIQLFHRILPVNSIDKLVSQLDRNYFFFSTEVEKHVDMPVMIGSGVTSSNLHNYVKAHALIIGSHFKHNGRLFHIYFKTSAVYIWRNVILLILSMQLGSRYRGESCTQIYGNRSRY